MWIGVSKLVLWLYFCTSIVYSYHASKLDYIKWQENYYKHNRNMVTTSTTTEKPVKSDLYESIKLRHQSRFPHTERLAHSLQSAVTKTSVSDLGYHRSRHSGYRHYTTTPTTTTTTEDSSLFDYGEFEYEGSDDSDGTDDYWEDEDGNTLEYEDDDTSYDDDIFYDNEWQAEEATVSTTSTTTTITPPPHRAPMSPLTEMKWSRYGTRERVEESRRNELQQSAEAAPSRQIPVHEVVNHYMRISTEGKCKKPLPRVVSVQSVHPDPNKTYIPQCTILHRCAEDTGCCLNDEQKCGPKTQNEIHLYFYAKLKGVTETRVESLTFYNHTECHCIEARRRTSRVSETFAESSQTNPSIGNMPHRRHSSPGHRQSLRCNCPRQFSPVYTITSCTCDCKEENDDCNRMKRGQEYISLTDRQCILEGSCNSPTCEYGAYKGSIGRCPRKHEKLEEFGRQSITL